MNSRRYKDVLEHPERWLNDQQRRWLRPRGLMACVAHGALYVGNWLAVHAVYRFEVLGLEHLPLQGPLIIAPNHSSPVDPSLLGAAFPLAFMQRTFWAGKTRTVMKNGLRRYFSWSARVIPIENDHTALAPALAILERGENLIWFPEGKRSLDGRLQPFKPGIAHLLTRCDVPIVPVFIQGAYAAFPAGAILPRWRSKVVVRIGPPLTAKTLGLFPPSENHVRRVVERLRQEVKQLSAESTELT